MGLTKNGRKIFGSLFTNQSKSSSSVYFGSLGLVNQLGEIASKALSLENSSTRIYDNVGYYITSACDINQLLTSYSNNYIYRLGICVGSGNNAETPDDYTLTSCGLTGKSIALTKGTDSTMIQGSVTAYNGTAEDIIVREIGLGLWGQNNESTNNPNAENCLLYRKVLDSPVTIHSDETYAFTLILK